MERCLQARPVSRSIAARVNAPLNAYAVYPQARYLSQRARRFIDFLAARFGEEPYWDAPLA